MRVYPLGYADPGTEQVVKDLMASNDHWIIADIRYKNVSGRWFASWSGKHLNMLYEGRYLHVPELGNLNYKEKKLPIVLAHPEIGLSIIRREMEVMHHDLIEESGIDLSDPMEGSYNRVVSTDYGPDDVLKDAANKAHITGQMFRFPMKTIMWINPGRVEVRPGYAAQEITIYPAN